MPGKCVCPLGHGVFYPERPPGQPCPGTVSSELLTPPTYSLVLGASQSSKRKALQAAWGWASVGLRVPRCSRAQADALGWRGEADLHQLLPSRVAFRDEAFHACCR